MFAIWCDSFVTTAALGTTAGFAVLGIVVPGPMSLVAVVAVSVASVAVGPGAEPQPCRTARSVFALFWENPSKVDQMYTLLYHLSSRPFALVSDKSVGPGSAQNVKVTLDYRNQGP